MADQFDNTDVVGWSGHEVTVLVQVSRDSRVIACDVRATDEGALALAADTYRLETSSFLGDEDAEAAAERFKRSLKRHGRANAGTVQFLLERRVVRP